MYQVKKTFNIDKLELTYSLTDYKKTFYSTRDTEIVLGNQNDIKLKRNLKATNSYSVMFDVTCKKKKIGSFFFGSSRSIRQNAYILVDNTLLYNGGLQLLPYVECSLGLVFKKISKLDVCLDTDVNVQKMFYKLLRDPNETIVVNGKSIRDRSQPLDSILYISKGCLNNLHKVKTLEVICKNRKNLLRVYDKHNEIETTSHKEYITQAHGFGKNRLYRMEISLGGCKAITKAFEDICFTHAYVHVNLSNQEVLSKIFMVTLNRLIRLLALKHHAGKRNILEYMGIA